MSSPGKPMSAEAVLGGVCLEVVWLLPAALLTVSGPYISRMEKVDQK